MLIFFLILTNLLCRETQADGTNEMPTPDTITNPISAPEKNQALRSRFFTEIMTSGFDGRTYVPAEDGSELNPANAFSMLWIDYPIAENTRIGYWQRWNANLTGPQGVRFRNPRLEIRKLNVWKKKGISSTYDFYLQPGIAPEGESIASGGSGRSLEIGMRTSQSYSIPESNWNIGMITEITKAFSFKGPARANVYGWALPWIEHEWSKRFYHQHYFTLSLQQLGKDPWYHIVYDYPMPLATQNGISYQLNDTINLSFFVDNYLNTLPTLKNTWFSFWLSAVLL